MAWYLSWLESQIHTLKVGGSSPPHATNSYYMEKQEAIDIINRKNDQKKKTIGFSKVIKRNLVLACLERTDILNEVIAMEPKKHENWKDK